MILKSEIYKYQQMNIFYFLLVFIYIIFVSGLHDKLSDLIPNISYKSQVISSSAIVLCIIKSFKSITYVGKYRITFILIGDLQKFKQIANKIQISKHL